MASTELSPTQRQQDAVRVTNLSEVVVRPSGNHVHLSHADAEVLFPGGLTPKRILPSGVYWIANERVTLDDPRGGWGFSLSVLGPCRETTQVELSATDASRWGFPVVRRMSGDLDGTPGFRLFSGKRAVTCDRGMIVPIPHAHLRPVTFLRLVEASVPMVPTMAEVTWLCTDVGSIRLAVRRNMDVLNQEIHLTYDEWNSLGLPGADAWCAGWSVAPAKWMATG